MIYLRTSPRQLRAQHPVPDISILTPGNPNNEQLLNALYDGIFTRYFPMYKDQENPRNWLKRLNNPSASAKTLIGVSGFDLHIPAKRLLSGMFMCTYYPQTCCAMLEYNVVDAAFQGQKLGRDQGLAYTFALNAMARTDGYSFKHIFAECVAPCATPAPDTMSPERRIEIYGHMGGMAVPVDYACPEPTDTPESKPRLLLLTFPNTETGHYADCDTTLAFLRASYIDRKLNPDTESAFLHMQAQINAKAAQNNAYALADTAAWLRPIIDNAGRCAIHL